MLSKHVICFDGQPSRLDSAAISIQFPASLCSEVNYNGTIPLGGVQPSRKCEAKLERNLPDQSIIMLVLMP